MFKIAGLCVCMFFSFNLHISSVWSAGVRHMTNNDEGSVSFNGRGFLRVVNPSSTRVIFAQSLSFKTFSSEGLLMFGKKKSDYLSLELSEGKVLLRVSIKGQTTTLKTSNTYNNGKWTTVFTVITQQTIFETGQNDRIPETLTAYVSSNENLHFKFLYFGGLVGIEDTQYEIVTRQHYFGCLKNANVLPERIDLTQGSRSKGVSVNCTGQDPIIVSFPTPNGRFKNLHPTYFFHIDELILFFNTQTSFGLIAYLSDIFHRNVLVVELIDGRVEVRLGNPPVNGNNSTQVTRLTSNRDSYHDGEWHFARVTFLTTSNEQRVKLVVDDIDEVVGNCETLHRPYLYAEGVLFLGSLPTTVPYNTDVIPVLRPFFGCIANTHSTNFESGNISCSVGEDTTFSQTSYDIYDTTETMLIVPTTEDLESRACGWSEFVTDPLDYGAFYFGSTHESRFEFESLGRWYITEDEMSFGLKTAAEFGVLYYTSDNRQFDFTTLYLFHGRLVYSFNYGSGDVDIQSSVRVNDNWWHEIRTIRSGSVGRIFLDGINVAEGTISGSSRYLSVETPLYVGGLPSDWPALDLPAESRISLVGCIKHFTVVPPRVLLSEFAVTRCESNREHGVFFGRDGGYIFIDNTPTVGFNMEISVEIKPRKSSGLIFSVNYPGRDFISLDMRSGELFLTMKNGHSEFIATFAFNESTVCDGKWHKVTAVKGAHEAYIEVDNVKGNTIQQHQANNEANNNHPFYFGGLPCMSYSGNYFGCMRNIIINGQPTSSPYSGYVGDVVERSCQTA